MKFHQINKKLSMLMWNNMKRYINILTLIKKLIYKNIGYGCITHLNIEIVLKEIVNNYKIISKKFMIR